MNQFQTSEGRAGKGRIKAEKTSDDVERKGTPEIGRRKKKKKDHAPSGASKRA